MEAVGEDEPAGHANPAVHSPLQSELVIPCADPYKPLAHGVQLEALARLHCPAGHVIMVAEVVPGGQARPAGHDPLHVDWVCPGLLQYVPGSHGPVHTALVMPLAAPYWPEGHWEHAPEPARL
jgi:hypothetical protein